MNDELIVIKYAHDAVLLAESLEGLLEHFNGVTQTREQYDSEIKYMVISKPLE